MGLIQQQKTKQVS
uniref:Uncharacterized protein n=1 Tax=Anguilla anguilla TaxID=7936 RepID=A0A0E9QHU4_ANGAN